MQSSAVSGLSTFWKKGLADTFGSRSCRDDILKTIRIISPRRTVWSSHPLIALTASGDGLKQARQDADTQRIAWEKHGFRSGLIGIQNDPKVMNIVGIPATIPSVLPLPRPKVMDRLIQYLNQ